MTNPPEPEQLPRSPNAAGAAQPGEGSGAEDNAASDATATTTPLDTPPVREAPPPPDGSDTNEFRPVAGGRFLLSRKIDLVAIVALLLSIGAIFIPVLNWLKGADLRLLPPDQVFLWQVTYPGNPPEALFGTTLIYVNKGDKGYGAIVRREALHVTIAGKDFELGWDKFADFKDSKPIDKGAKQAMPFPVDGRASETHETSFVAWPRLCAAPAQGPCDVLGNHVKWDDFISELRGIVQAGRHEFEFNFTAELIDAKPITASCKIVIDKPTVDVIESSKGYSPTCFPK
jgi:hypothetical protein